MGTKERIMDVELVDDTKNTTDSNNLYVTYFAIKGHEIITY